MGSANSLYAGEPAEGRRFELRELALREADVQRRRLSAGAGPRVL